MLSDWNFLTQRNVEKLANLVLQSLYAITPSELK